MNSKQVSVAAILDGIDHLKTQFTNHMTEETQKVNEAYDSLRAGGLTSANIDSIVSEIKTRIARLQQDFEQVEEGIRKDLNASAETIDASNKSIMDNLNRG